jgi:hypothetical protein
MTISTQQFLISYKLCYYDTVCTYVAIFILITVHSYKLHFLVRAIGDSICTYVQYVETEITDQSNLSWRIVHTCMYVHSHVIFYVSYII